MRRGREWCPLSCHPHSPLYSISSTFTFLSPSCHPPPSLPHMSNTAFVLGTGFYFLCLPCFLCKCIGEREREGEGEGEGEGGRSAREDGREDGRGDGGEEGERELRQQYTGCVSFWGNTLLGLLLIPLFLAIVLLCFVVTFIQVLVTSINTRFGVCCAEKSGRGGGGGGGAAATVVAGIGSTAVAMTRSLSRGGAGERRGEGTGAGAGAGAGAEAGGSQGGGQEGGRGGGRGSSRSIAGELETFSMPSFVYGAGERGGGQDEGGGQYIRGGRRK